MAVQKMSEARLNDLAYMALKRYFFQPWGRGNPRECDIRVVMDMAVPERISVMSAILLPNEVSGRSHTKFYEVDTDRVLQEALDYMEDHWIKEELKSDFVTDVKADWPGVVEDVLKMPEESCAGSV